MNNFISNKINGKRYKISKTIFSKYFIRDSSNKSHCNIISKMGLCLANSGGCPASAHGCLLSSSYSL